MYGCKIKKTSFSYYFLKILKFLYPFFSIYPPRFLQSTLFGYFSNTKDKLSPDFFQFLLPNMRMTMCCIQGDAAACSGIIERNHWAGTVQTTERFPHSWSIFLEQKYVFEVCFLSESDARCTIVTVIKAVGAGWVLVDMNPHLGTAHEPAGLNYSKCELMGP